jgi:hypothetical protein
MQQYNKINIYKRIDKINYTKGWGVKLSGLRSNNQHLRRSHEGIDRLVACLQESR